MKKNFLALTMVIAIVGSLLSGCGKSVKSESKDIGENKAKEIAFTAAGVQEKDLSRLKISKERDDLKTVYDIEFTDHANGMEYDYEILASDGSIYSAESEKFDNIPDTTKENGTQMKITQEEASKLALDKVSGATAENLYIQLEMEHGTYVYDGEIVYNNKEYDFEIDANTGEFLEWREKTI